MGDVLWEDPPPEPNGGRLDRMAILEAVCQHPSRWARMGQWTNKSTAAQAASDVRRGRILQPVDGAYEARWAELDGQPGVYGVWVRFVPAK